MREIILRRDGIIERTMEKSPLTSKDSWYEGEMIRYQELHPNMNLVGIQKIEPIIEGNALKEIKFTVEDFNMNANSAHRGESRRDRIAKFLIENKGKSFTAKELRKSVEPNADLYNFQYQATLLTREKRGFAKVHKDGFVAYIYSG